VLLVLGSVVNLGLVSLADPEVASPAWLTAQRIRLAITWKSPARVSLILLMMNDLGIAITWRRGAHAAG
jgi:hypothetical protein